MRFVIVLMHARCATRAPDPLKPEMLPRKIPQQVVRRTWGSCGSPELASLCMTAEAKHLCAIGFPIPSFQFSPFNLMVTESEEESR